MKLCLRRSFIEIFTCIEILFLCMLLDSIKSWRGVEQWLARWAHNPKVGGSNPFPAIFYKQVQICFLAMKQQLQFILVRRHSSVGRATES